MGATLGVPENPAFFSSGGFSNIFTQPSYQSTAVAGYLAIQGSENAGLFNPSGRAFPDVSAIGFLVDIILAGNEVSVMGTSASSPIFASCIALINDGLIANGKSPMGFLNPFLYSSAASTFNDQVNGQEHLREYLTAADAP